MKTLAILTVTLAGILVVGEAQANSHRRSHHHHGSHHGHRHHHHGDWGTGFRGVHGHVRRTNRYWHNTGHYDYVPGTIVPHGNHYDYIPGGHYWHNTGHYHRR